MPDSRLWLLNHTGTAFSITAQQQKFSQLENTWDDSVLVKRLAASHWCTWSVGHDHRVYVYVLSSDVPIRIPETTYENQRWTPFHEFSKSGLLPTDRRPWSDETGVNYKPKENIRLPSAHWEWEGDWMIDDNLRGEVMGIEGWQYAFDFPAVYTPEKHWNSFVRKRKWIRFRRYSATDVWARISDMEVVERSECFMDISIGGSHLPSQPPGFLSVWGVTNNGCVYVRTNVHHDNPEGDSWQEISISEHMGIVNVAVGAGNLVWAVTVDGQALVRTDVTRDNVYGKRWTVVEYPTESTRLMHISVGKNAVWALSRQGKVWFRKGTCGDDMFWVRDLAVGSSWVEMVGEMSHIAVSSNDQVFGIDLSGYKIYFRTGVNGSDLTGKTWQRVSLHEDLTALEQEGRLCEGLVCYCDNQDTDCPLHSESRPRNSSTTTTSSTYSTATNFDDSNSDAFLSPSTPQMPFPSVLSRSGSLIDTLPPAWQGSGPMEDVDEEGAFLDACDLCPPPSLASPTEQSSSVSAEKVSEEEHQRARTCSNSCTLTASMSPQSTVLQELTDSDHLTDSGKDLNTPKEDDLKTMSSSDLSQNESSHSSKDSEFQDQQKYEEKTVQDKEPSCVVGGNSELRSHDVSDFSPKETSQLSKHSMSEDQQNYSNDSESLNQGDSESLNPGDSESLNPGDSESLNQGDSESLNQGDSESVNPGDSLNQGDSKSVNQGDSKSVNQGDSKSVNQGDSESLNQGDLESVNQGDSESINPGDSLNQGDSKSVNQGDSESLNQGDLESVNQGDSESINQGDSESINQGDLEFVNEGDSKSLNQGKVEDTTDGEKELSIKAVLPDGGQSLVEKSVEPLLSEVDESRESHREAVKFFSESATREEPTQSPSSQNPVFALKSFFSGIHVPNIKGILNISNKTAEMTDNEFDALPVSPVEDLTVSGTDSEEPRRNVPGNMSHCHNKSHKKRSKENRSKIQYLPPVNYDPDSIVFSHAKEKKKGRRKKGGDRSPKSNDLEESFNPNSQFMSLPCVREGLDSLSSPDAESYPSLPTTIPDSQSGGAEDVQRQNSNILNSQKPLVGVPQQNLDDCPAQSLHQNSEKSQNSFQQSNEDKSLQQNPEGCSNNDFPHIIEDAVHESLRETDNENLQRNDELTSNNNLQQSKEDSIPESVNEELKESTNISERVHENSEEACSGKFHGNSEDVICKNVHESLKENASEHVSHTSEAIHDKSFQMSASDQASVSPAERQTRLEVRSSNEAPLHNTSAVSCAVFKEETEEVLDVQQTDCDYVQSNNDAKNSPVPGAQHEDVDAGGCVLQTSHLCIKENVIHDTLPSTVSPHSEFHSGPEKDGLSLGHSDCLTRRDSFDSEHSQKSAGFAKPMGDNLNSSLDSDEIIDFVTDLMPSDEEESLDACAKHCFSFTEQQENGMKVNNPSQSEKDPRHNFDSQTSMSSVVSVSTVQGSQSEEMEVSVSDDNSSNEQTLPSPLTMIQPARKRPLYRKSPAPSTLSVSDSETTQAFTLMPAQERLSWKLLDATCFIVEDPSSVSWLAQANKGSESHKKVVKISRHLRDNIMKQIEERNKRETERFRNYEEAIVRATWVKKASMQMYLYGKNKRWVSCNVELEQGIGMAREGCLTAHYNHKKDRKNVRIGFDEISCVKICSDPDLQTAFTIYTPVTNVIQEPIMLKANSEKEALEWMGYLCAANATQWNLNSPIERGAIWSCTFAGDVLVTPATQGISKPFDLFWGQHGGHLSLVESGPSGVTWAIGFDKMPYVYNGGYGGAVNVDVSGMSDNTQQMTDFQVVHVFESEKWFPLVGWCKKSVLKDNFHWLTENGRSVSSKAAVKLPSSKWQWINEWSVDFTTPGGVDKQGWQFSSSMYGHFHRSLNIRHTFRRRRWIRKCRLTTLGPWNTAGSLGLVDLSIQIDPQVTPSEPIVIWAVGANGDVLCRYGVTTRNPLGQSWIHVATDLDKPFRSISVGGSCRVWGIASDGSAWFRTGVTPYSPAGTCWLQVVPPPPGYSPLRQVSAGGTAVWAVDTRDNLWRRENITPTFPEGTGWEMVASRVKRVSVGPRDQVWVVTDTGFTRLKHGPGAIFNRTGISPDKPSGTEWELVIGSGWAHVCVRGAGDAKIIQTQVKEMEKSDEDVVKT